MRVTVMTLRLAAERADGESLHGEIDLTGDESEMLDQRRGLCADKTRSLFAFRQVVMYVVAGLENR